MNTTDSFDEHPWETRRNGNFYEYRLHHRCYYCSQKLHNTFLFVFEGAEDVSPTLKLSFISLMTQQTDETLENPTKTSIRRPDRVTGSLAIVFARLPIQCGAGNCKKGYCNECHVPVHTRKNFSSFFASFFGGNTCMCFSSISIPCTSLSDNIQSVYSLSKMFYIL